MFIVTAPFFLCTHSTWLWCMAGRTGAPHSVTRPRGVERAPDPWVEVDREGARARYRCLQRVVALLDKVAWLRVHLPSKLDVNSRPEGSFFFICVFVFVACAIKKRVHKKKKKKVRAGVVRAPHAQHASYAPEDRMEKVRTMVVSCIDRPQCSGPTCETVSTRSDPESFPQKFHKIFAWRSASATELLVAKHTQSVLWMLCIDRPFCCGSKPQTVHKDKNHVTSWQTMGYRKIAI